jgi:phosphate transport system permease protein
VKGRKREEALFKTLMLLSLGLLLAAVVGVVGVVLLRGASAISFSMLVKLPKGGYYLGKEGGIANAVVGSLALAFGASLCSIVFSLPVAFALQREYVKPTFAHFTRITLDILWGTPSIVFGAFGFVVMRMLGLRASLLGGIIVLTLLMIPIMTRSIDEVIRMVPHELKEAAYALGSTRAEVTTVVLKQVTPGIVMGFVLAFGRGIGDAASILFTAGYSDYLPRSLLEPVASLPLAVFFLINTPSPEVQNRAYAAAFVLLAIVLLTSLGARLLSRRFSRHIIF